MSPPFGDQAALRSRTRFTSNREKKLIALQLLLRSVERETVYDVRVVNVPLAQIGLLERTVLLISEKALALLSAEELTAAAAHEVAHEYFAAEHERATNAKDYRRLREIELMCDAFGMVMLHDIGLSPSRLVRSVEKVTLYNRRMSHKDVGESNYPTLDERRKFAAAVQQWMRGQKGQETKPFPFSLVPFPLLTSLSQTQTHTACCRRPARRRSPAPPTARHALTW